MKSSVVAPELANRFAAEANTRHVGDVGLNTAKPLELALGLVGDDLRQAGFPCPVPVKN